ncbi:MAG: protecting protein DprA [Fibrobacteres bacterium]|nr:protecting protein DprA [Fibrobacterota bacterium]
MPPQELQKMLALAMAPGVGPATFHRLLDAFGSAEGVFGAAAAELTAVCPQLKSEGIEAIQAGPNLRAVRFQEETCARLKVRIVSVRSPAYPSPLRSLPQPPPFLFMAGEWRPEDRKSLAVVGTRYPSGYGSRMARDLTAGMGAAGFTIVSGLARGIDTVSHEAALETGSRTIAVLGSGLDWIYPPENVPLARRIAKHGSVISEFPMGVAPHATHFPRRNRLISALSLGTLVVEAGNDSGALITADYAMDQGREVFAVPGAVHQPGSQGTHKLIQEGAHLVERAADIVALLQGTSQAVPSRRFAMIGAGAGEQGSGTGGVSGEPLELAFGDGGTENASDALDLQPSGMRAVKTWRAVPGKDSDASTPDPSTALEAAAAGLDDEARSLLSLIGREALTLDAIAEKARRKPRFRNTAAHRLLAGLLDLELKGRVKRMPGALFRLA